MSVLNREKNKVFYQREEIVTDVTTGEIISATTKTMTKTSAEPDYIKVYYETMMAFNKIHDIPVSFVLSLSKFLEWTNDGKPQCTTLNKRVKGIMSEDCNVSLPQIDRYIKKSVDNGLLFRTEFRGVYEVNPFMIAKGKWESIKKLRSNFDYIDGKWTRVIEYKEPDECEDVKDARTGNGQAMDHMQIEGQMEIKDTDCHIA